MGKNKNRRITVDNAYDILNETLIQYNREKK